MPTTVAVVGGGPAGLMAAEVLASADEGFRVVVFDRMPSMGRKLQLAGRGGLNLTHTEGQDRFMARYGPAADRLAPAIDAFGPDALGSWSTGLGQRAVVGTSGRVFPEAFRTTPLLRAWLARLDDLGVERRHRMTWTGWTERGDLDFGTETVAADAVVLALGGASWPRTGSDGSWVEPLADSGIQVAPLRPANVGCCVEWSEHFRTRFAGSPIKNVRLTVGGHSAPGDVMVTSTGLEGGPIYALGRALREELDQQATAQLHVDLRPGLTAAELDARLARRRPKDSSSTTLRRAAGLTPAAVALLRESRTPRAGGGGREIKDIALRVTGTEAIDRAISTAGGVRFDEVDERLMLRLRPGTFVAGEMLDWEAPTGGYLLQATFSTGVAAARGVIEWMTETR